MRYPSGTTHLWAILGDPVAHVRAPFFFNPKFEALGLDAFLVALHAPEAELVPILHGLRRIPNLKGLIVTIPHKEAMLALVDEVGPQARLCGALNTVRIEPGGRLVGEMFDGLGLLAAMRAHGLEPKGAHHLLVGAGGAARAIAFALAAAGAAEVAIWNRTAERAARLAAEVARAFPAVRATAAPPDGRGFDVVVQCTALGMHAGDPLPIDPAILAPPTALVEIIAVRETELMTAAAARGCTVVGGRPMAELQIDAQLAFIGRPPPLART